MPTSRAHTVSLPPVACEAPAQPCQHWGVQSLAVLRGGLWQELGLSFIYISLMLDDVEHLLMCLIVPSGFYLVTRLPQPSVHFYWVVYFLTIEF